MCDCTLSNVSCRANPACKVTHCECEALAEGTVVQNLLRTLGSIIIAELSLLEEGWREREREGKDTILDC